MTAKQLNDDRCLVCECVPQACDCSKKLKAAAEKYLKDERDQEQIMDDATTGWDEGGWL